jgi:hypothetical protein
VLVLLFAIKITARIPDYDHEHEYEIAWRDLLPTLAGISNRGEALAKFGLLAVRFPFLVRLACLLLRTRTRGTTAWQYEQERRNEKNHCRQLFHTKLATPR